MFVVVETIIFGIVCIVLALLIQPMIRVSLRLSKNFIKKADTMIYAKYDDQLAVIKLERKIDDIKNNMCNLCNITHNQNKQR
jgi:hypothetical protein